MPVHRVPLKPAPQTEDLTRRLGEEWRNPGGDDPARPNIIEEEIAGGRLRVYVIWDEWGKMSVQERSRIILDALEAAKGKAECAKVSMAWGLTKAEAEKLGLPAA